MEFWTWHGSLKDALFEFDPFGIAADLAKGDESCKGFRPEHHSMYLIESWCTFHNTRDSI